MISATARNPMVQPTRAISQMIGADTNHIATR